MKQQAIEVLKEYWQNCLTCYVEEEEDLVKPSFLREEDANACSRKLKEQKMRDCTTMKNSVEVQVINEEQLGERIAFEYLVKIMYFHFHKGKAYLEEVHQLRCGVIDDKELVDDYLLYPDGSGENELMLSSTEEQTTSKNQSDNRNIYDRMAVVRYAERWWDGHNPQYHLFNDDCTNFISQCLRAGGAPMRGRPSRGQGWWYSGELWSFSWAVAHSFRWYLSGSNKGLQAREVDSPEDLLKGDVICYDFTGDGKWQHTTVVVDKDANSMPLVNAHTTNSRMRYWSYEDSTAWTPQIQYKFFQIIDELF